MAFSTISTFSSLKFPTSTGISINYVYPDINIDGSMSIYYTFNFSSGTSIPNYKNGTTTLYDATIIGDGSIDNTLPNYIIGNGALKLTNTENSQASQYVQNIVPIDMSKNPNNLSISVWFNPSSLSANNLYSLFDIVGNVGFNGIQVDLSGTNNICFGYYDTFPPTTNLFFNNIDNSMAILYYPFNTATNKILPNYSQSNVVYDGTIMGDATITNNTANYIIGNGALQVSNNVDANANTATQYVRNNSVISTSEIPEMTISVWFNPSSSLSANGFYTLFDIAGSVGSKGIQLDLSGTNTICSELFY
jgi:hypothetical protein